MSLKQLDVFSLAVVTLLLASASSVANAEPLVTMDQGKAKPGVVTSWSGSGKKINLTVKEGTDANAVAKAIEDGTGAKAKVTGGKILVIGKSEQELLQAMAAVDFGGDVLALADASNRDDFDSGSSLRAKKTADLKKLMQDPTKTAQGKVAGVSFTSFPETVVSVRVLRAPTGELGKTIRKGATIKFRPVFKKKGQNIDWSDESNQHNAGAWYLQNGDTVDIKIGKESGGIYEAEVLSR